MGRWGWSQASFKRDREEDSVNPGLEVKLLGPARELEVVGEGKGNQERHLGFWLKLVNVEEQQGGWKGSRVVFI